LRKPPVAKLLKNFPKFCGTGVFIVAFTAAINIIYLSTVLFEFLNLVTQSVGFLGRGISPSQGRYLHTRQQKH
jgi:hypothetical protein